MIRRASITGRFFPGKGAYYNPDFRTAAGPVRHQGHTTDIITDLTLDWLKEKRDPGKPFMLMYQHKAPHRNWMPGAEYLSMYDGETLPEPETLFDDYSHRASPAGKQTMEIGRHMTDAYDLKLAPHSPDGVAGAGSTALGEYVRPPNGRAAQALVRGL